MFLKNFIISKFFVNLFNILNEYDFDKITKNIDGTGRDFKDIAGTTGRMRLMDSTPLLNWLATSTCQKTVKNLAKWNLWSVQLWIF